MSPAVGDMGYREAGAAKQHDGRSPGLQAGNHGNEKFRGFSPGLVRRFTFVVGTCDLQVAQNHGRAERLQPLRSILPQMRFVSGHLSNLERH